MKGVIRARTSADLIDITHQFQRQNVRAAAFWLQEILAWFPPSVHLIVVDPGVGSDRRALVIRSGGHAFVGPDNGVMIPAARRIGTHETIESFEIEIRESSSATFHGRDVFAPMAAEVHELGIKSIETHDRLDPIDDVTDLRFPECQATETGVRGEVLVIDGFGNVITNVPGRMIERHIGERIEVNSIPVSIERTYSAVGIGERLITIGSHGNVELAVNRGRGDDEFHVKEGSTVELQW